MVGLGDKVSPTDIEEGMRVGYAILYFQIKHIISLKVFSSFTISYLVIHFYYITMMHLYTCEKCIQNWPIFPVIICKKMICIMQAACLMGTMLINLSYYLLEGLKKQWTFV